MFFNYDMAFFRNLPKNRENQNFVNVKNQLGKNIEQKIPIKNFHRSHIVVQQSAKMSNLIKIFNSTTQKMARKNPTFVVEMEKFITSAWPGKQPLSFYSSFYVFSWHKNVYHPRHKSRTIFKFLKT